MTPLPTTTSTLKRPRKLSLVYFASLIALVWLAQAEQPRVVVLVAFVVYAVVATLWTREQYVESVRGHRFVAPAAAVEGLLLVGVLLVVAGLVLGNRSAAPLPWVAPGDLVAFGVIALYLGFGYAISSSRARIAAQGSIPDPTSLFERLIAPLGRLSRSWPALVGVLVAMGGVLVVGLLLLGRADTVVAAGLIGLGVVGVPWVVSLLSEHAIRALDDLEDQQVRGLLVAVGAVLVLGGTAVSRLWGGSWLPVLLLAGLALLMFALASSTLADIAVVIALIALIGLTPRQDRALEATTPRDNSILVALGDSYMSGEGASTFITGTDQGGENECRRASTAWAVLAGKQPPFDGVEFYPCSGADTFNVRAQDGLEPKPAPQAGEPGTQLEQYAARDPALPEPTLVVLSMGGNDAGFAKIGLTCLAPGRCDDPEPAALWKDGNLDRVENRLRQLYQQVDRVFAETPVAVTLYPDPIHPAGPCPEADLDRGDIDFVETFLHELNLRIIKVAGDYGFHVITSMTIALQTQELQLCDPANNDRPGLNFVGVRSVGGFAEQRLNPTKWTHNSLHPNERGHVALHIAFQRWLSLQGGLDELPLRRAKSAPLPEVTSETYPAKVAGCAAVPVEDADGCQARSTDWALRQTGQFVVVRGSLAVVVMVGAWLCAVVFFAWRRLRAGPPPSEG